MTHKSLVHYLFFLGTFRNGVSLIHNYRSGGMLADGPIADEAVLWGGARLVHPHSSGLVGTLLEIWADNAYQIGDFYTPRRGDVILDVGAHIGLFSLYLARRGDGARILALEPSAENFACLEQNVRATGARSIEVHRLAIGGAPGKVKIMPAVRSVDTRTAPAASGDADTVEVVTLDSLFALAKTDRIALLKMDVEGAEHDAFERVDVSTLSRIERIALEYHDHWRPGTLDLLWKKLSPTHRLTVLPDRGRDHGRLLAVLRGAAP